MFELTTYRPPFRAGTQQELLQKHILEKPVPPLSLVSELTQEFNDLVLRAWQRNANRGRRAFTRC